MVQQRLPLQWSSPYEREPSKASARLCGDLDVGQVTDSVASDQLMLSIHELHVSFDELLSLLAHLVGFAGELGEVIPELKVSVLSPWRYR